jgi:hypothetical protein
VISRPGKRASTSGRRRELCDGSVARDRQEGRVGLALAFDKRKRMTQAVHHSGAILLAALALVSCGGGGGAQSPTSASGSSASGCPSSSTVGTPTTVRPAGWSEATHGKDAATAYDAVFPPNAVTRFDLEISAACWQLLFDDLASMIGQSFPTTRSSIDGTGGAARPAAAVLRPAGAVRAAAMASSSRGRPCGFP